MSEHEKNEDMKPKGEELQEQEQEQEVVQEQEQEVEQKQKLYVNHTEEFGPEAFEEEEADELAEEKDLQGAAAASTRSGSGSSKLPWLLFAVSVIAIGVLLFTGRSGMSSQAAAKVNGDKITKQEVYDALNKQDNGATLDNLITQKIIDQQAKKKNVTITDADVDAELKDIKSQFPDETQFQAALDQNKLTLEELRKQIHDQLQLTKLYEGQMDVSDAKLKDYYDKNKESFGTPEQVELSQIVLEKKEDADKVVADLKGGTDFAAEAKSKSADTATKDKGGAMGFVSSAQVDPAIATEAFKLDKGGISPVITTSQGTFVVVKVTDKKAAVTPAFDQVKDKVKKEMVQSELSEKGSAWMDQLKKDAKIEKL